MYAQVIVDLSAEALDRVFSYIVPEGMDLAPGQLVTVPFGPRTVEGFVVSLSDACDVPPGKLKQVIRPVRAEPVVQPDLMALAEWMDEAERESGNAGTRCGVVVHHRRGRGAARIADSYVTMRLGDFAALLTMILEGDR